MSGLDDTGPVYSGGGMSVCYCTGACHETGRCPHTGASVKQVKQTAPWSPENPWNPRPQKPLVPMVPAHGRERIIMPPLSPPTEIYPCKACHGEGTREGEVCPGCHGSGVHRV